MCIRGLLIFLIHINDLSNDLSSNVKLFAEGKSLLSIVHAKTICANEFKTDLEKINNWSYQ